MVDNENRTGRTRLRILEVIAVLATLATALIGLQTARISRDAEQLKEQQQEIRSSQSSIASNQASIQSEVQRNGDRTRKLEEQVNKISTTGDLNLAKALSGTWEGQYRCSQGLTGLKLVIYVEDESTVLATFNFFPLPSNPGVPSGSYAMKGTYSSTSISLVGDYWIGQVPGYGMVDLTANIDDETPKKLSGSVSAGCKNFEITKTSDSTQKPSI